MRYFLILAFLLTAIPAAAQEHLGHFKTNPNGTDSISTPSGAYGDSISDAVNNPINDPYKMSGDVPANSSPTTPLPTNAPGRYGSQGNDRDSLTANPSDAAPASNL